MSNLSFEQSTILNLYPYFFGDEYSKSEKDDEAKTLSHINIQKMCYLLKVKGIEIGDFYFTWNVYGPFSPGLASLIHSLDNKKDEIRSYYDNNKGNFVLEKDKQKITDLIRDLELSSHSDDKLWIELLGSIVFLSNSEFPGEGFKCINQKLIEKKPKFSDENKNMMAWNVLKKANLIKILPKCEY